LRTEELPSMRRQQVALVLLLGVLILLPIGRTSELPLVCAALWGVFLWLRGRLAFSRALGVEAELQPGQPKSDSLLKSTPGTDLRLVLALFACYWLPIVFSAPTSVDAQHTWTTAAATLRFLPFALFAGWAMRHAAAAPPFTLAVAAVLALWILDAWVQWVLGYSLGGPPERERLSGIFGADNLKLGPVLAVLSPFFLMVARSVAGRLGLLAAFVVLLVPILLAGSRSAWISFAIVAVVFAWRETRSLRRFMPLLIGVAVAIVFSLVTVWRDMSGFEARIERSLLALQGTPQALDEALAGRVSIWRTAGTMIGEHPVTGVGVRGFRHAYLEHAQKGDWFAWEGAQVGAFHAHQIVLEILSETGVVGLLFWLIGAWLAIRAWRRADLAARGRAFAPGLALVAMCFPLNSHFAFYSAWWGLLFWWLLAIYCAALAGGRIGATDRPRGAQRVQRDPA